MTEQEEAALVEWVKDSSRRGFGKTADDVCKVVKTVLDRAGKKVEIFNSNRPWRTWWFGFFNAPPCIEYEEA